MAINISNFNPEKARTFVLEYEDPMVREWVTLLYHRDIENLSISDPAFLAQQKKLLPQLQTGLTTWLEKNKKRLYAFCEVIAYFGYLGLNGTKIPQLVNAIESAFTTFPRKDGAFTNKAGQKRKCPNTAFLRGALALGFSPHSQVKDACLEYLTDIKGAEGACEVRTDGNPCAYVLIKTLRMLNDFPHNWRNRKYHEAVSNIQNYLLSYNLSTADYPRRRPAPNKNWFKYGYFRSYQSSIFEAAEALVLSGVKDHPELEKALEAIGSACINEVTWTPKYIQKAWPLPLETKELGKVYGSPWLTLRGLRITNKS